MLTVGDFDTLTGELQSIFNETAKAKVAQSVGMQIFDVTDTELLDFKHQILHGVAGLQKVAEGSDFPIVNSEEGDNITYTQAKYGVQVNITDEMRRFWRAQNGKAADLVRTVTDEAFDKIDQSMADVLLKGWSTSYTDVYGQTISGLGPDSLALFSASHTNGTTATTYSNIINDGTNNNPTFSRNAIVKARAAARKYTDPQGLHRPVMLDTLVVGPDLEDEAVRTIQSELIPGSANNDTNRNISGTKVMVWDRLGSASDGTDTSAYWFMMDSAKVMETLKAIFAKRPSLDPPEVVYQNKNWEYTLFFYYVLGRGFAPYLFGSNGTNA